MPRDGGLAVDGMLQAAHDGKLRVLSLFGTNPALQHPRGERYVRAALAAVPFVVASELFLTETSSLANLVLPARGAFEKSGHTYDLAGDVLAVNAGHAAPPGTLSDGEMLVALAAELEIDIPAPAEITAAATAPLSYPGIGFGDASFSDAVSLRTNDARVSEAGRPPDGLRIALAANIFSGGGTVHFDEALSALRPHATVTFAPATALALGIAAGDYVTIVGSAGAALPELARSHRRTRAGRYRGRHRRIYRRPPRTVSATAKPSRSR